MILSMTGFASNNSTLQLETGNTVHVSMQLKSLNSRFFEASCRFPIAFGSLETEYIKLLKEQLRRGQVYFTIYVDDQQAFKSPITASKPTLDGYMHAIEEIRKEYPIESTITVSDLLRMQNLFVSHDADLTDNVKQQLTDQVKAVVTDLIATRKREGEQIEADLTARMNHMDEVITELEKVYSAYFAERKQQLQDEFEQNKPSNQEMADTQRNQLYATLDRMDLHEEITRFKGHLEQLQSIVSDESIENGKKLDFTLQELGREANTIASKCGHAGISNMAITLKVELEKCREQVQNVV